MNTIIVDKVIFRIAYLDGGTGNKYFYKFQKYSSGYPTLSYLDINGNAYFSGSVGINKTPSNAKLDINGNVIISGSLTSTNNIIGSGSLYIYNTSSFYNYIKMCNTSSNWISFGQNGFAPPGNNSNGEKIQLFGALGRISSNDYAIGIESSNMWFNTQGGFKWYLNSTLQLEFQGVDDSSHLDLITYNNIYSYKDIIAFYSSDIRLKSNLRLIENNIDNLNVYKYTWNEKTDKNKIGKDDYRLIAQEVQKFYPEIVEERSDGYLGINYIKFVPILFSYIKDLKKEIENLTNRIKKLEEI